jgi:hypothetical protein
MVEKIEKMNRMRKNIVRGILVGTAIAFVWFILPNLGLGNLENNYQTAVKALAYAGILWLLSLVIFGTIYWRYRKIIKRDPLLHEAVNDERVKVSWLKAYRFAFFVTLIISILWKRYEMNMTNPNHLNLVGRFTKLVHLPNGPFLLLYIAVISLLRGISLF